MQREQLLVHDAVAVSDLNGLAHQVDGDFGADQLVDVDDLEVDVGDHVADGVVLDVTGHGQQVLAVHVELEQRVEAGITGHGDLELTGDDRHRNGVRSVAIDHAGNLALGAQTTGRTRSDLAAGVGGERGLGHG